MYNLHLLFRMNILNKFDIRRALKMLMFVTLGAFSMTGISHAASDNQPEISAEFPYESKFIEILGSRMHYVEAGAGDPILLLHGNPTSSYLWRNVIPYLESRGRVIAVDLVGFGKSDKPDIPYRFDDHSRYLEEFIRKMELQNITLVVHDWGSALGLNYASRNEDNVKGVAFMEAFVPPALPVTSYEAMGSRLEPLFRKMRDPEEGPVMLIDNNAFIELMLPGAVVREMSEEEMNVYRAPFLDPDDRKPILVWPLEVPIGGIPQDNREMIEAYSAWMLESEMPFLHLYASPGSLNPPQVAAWLAERVENIETAFIGRGLHYVQEDQPEAIGRAIADWHRRLTN